MPVYTDKKTGRFFVQFDHQGETYKFRLPPDTTKKQAEKLETKKKNTLFFESHGFGRDHNDKLYEDFLIETYLPFMEANRSKVTFDQIVIVCKTSLKFLKGKTLRFIKRSDLERVKTARAETKTKHGKERKPATIVKEMSYISGVFSMAVDDDLCEYNPCSRVSMPKFDNVMDLILREENEEAFFSSFDSQWTADICKMVLNTGLRQKDIMFLTKFQVDLADGVIRRTQGKTKRRVEIPLNDEAREILERRVQSEAGEYLFPSPVTGKPGGSVRHTMQRACQRAEIPIVTIRDLRRTFGTRLHEKGYDDTTVAQLLGHADLRSIHRYKRGTAIKREAVESLPAGKKANPAKILPPKKLEKWLY